MLLTVRANVSKIEMKGEEEGRGWQPKSPEKGKKQTKKKECVEEKE